MPVSRRFALGGVDLVASYAYCFLANEVPFGSSGPRGHLDYWLTQPLAYLVIAPVALVATWRALTLSGRPGIPVWRLPLEGLLLAAGLVIAFSVLSRSSGTDILMTAIEAGGFAALLGLLLTGLNRAILQVWGRASRVAASPPSN